MDAEREVARSVRSWLRTDGYESADRVLEVVLARLDTTPQRRSWWLARRIHDMSTYARLAIAAAAVIVFAVVGINLLPSTRVAGGPAVTPSPSPSASPTPQPSPSPMPAIVFPPSGVWATATRHQTTGGGVRYSFTVPTSDWISNGEWGIDKGAGMGPDGAGFILWPEESPVGVYANPCASAMAPAVGPSAARLAAAVATIPGIDLVSGPTDVTVGGYPAKHVVVTIREDVKCRPEDFYLWYGYRDGNARYASQLGSTIRVWIVDVHGSIVWIDGETYKGAGKKPAQEIQQIVDSIQFE